MADTKRLFTPWGEQYKSENWQVYPRPQMKRDSYYCLNGQWDFCVADEGVTPLFNQKIEVPFAPQSILSGVEQAFDEDKILFYRKEFSLPDNFNKGRVLLHFGAVDQIARVYLNGNFIGSHTGGYDAFCFDITQHLADKNALIVEVVDRLSSYTLPYGKQCKKRGGMWYTEVSGIWQTVWIESVPQNYIKGLKIDADDRSVTITAEGIETGVVIIGDVSLPICEGKATYIPESPELWSPEHPHLYNFKVQSGEDCVESYFAMRKLEIKEVEGYPRLCLNGKPYFFHGLLDQGYYSDGIYTPASPQAYEFDIMKMKALGFNMLRKHIKVEPEQFYYDCDRLGMVVFQDMVNNGRYSFFRDTALPTIFGGKLNLNDKKLNKDAETRSQFAMGMVKTVNQLYNHPCICYWTIFNEGWGQFCADEMYDRLKELDQSRFIDSASGWFGGVKSDVDSRHVYFRKLKLSCKDKPLILSEFGGYSYKDNDHAFNTEQTYGYGKFDSREKFKDAFVDLYENQVMPLVKKGLSAAVYTQVSDVEDETNGLLSYDRKVEKILPEEFEGVSAKITQQTID
ncbi:MAG: glycoside hydrolase family 2 [Clostridia bacterium]|nr:glycoside hydrolase family 2 [Clostridia bacterium]